MELTSYMVGDNQKAVFKNRDPKDICNFRK